MKRETARLRDALDEALPLARYYVEHCERSARQCKEGNPRKEEWQDRAEWARGQYERALASVEKANG
jgi:predicted RNA polymerase sigma factor